MFYIVYEGKCENFSGYINTDGYGEVYRGKKKYMAHRVEYQAKVGPIPKNLVLDHLCRNRACINVKHLEPVTIAENVLRGNTIPANHVDQKTCLKCGTAKEICTTEGYRRCPKCRKQQFREATARYKKKKLITG